ncbi:MAG TPA: chemotaxis response regulator protein-glutamate methylesterase [Sporosarcina sp.]|nr:chemotaxis response regulator protein-glutamate methylesterase [Sporosarcina sp.]
MANRRKKKVLVVDDSAFMRKIISDIINKHSQMEVVDTARNGKDALQKLVQLKPDVITLDVEMPLMNGLEALKEIMRIQPTPVVMLSSTTKLGAENTMLAMENGAVDFIAKPGGAISLNLKDIEDEISKKVFAAAAVSVKKLSTTIGHPKQTQSKVLRPTMTKQSTIEQKRPVSEEKRPFHGTGKTIVAIGTSTGGPRALQQVLTHLPAHLAAPIVIVQHMPPGFTKSLADRLHHLSEISVTEVKDGEVLQNGTAYIAPGGKHFTVKKMGASLVAEVSDRLPPMKGHRPSVDVLFDSVASLTGMRCIATIMTGMGNDGLEGTKKLTSTIHTITIAEAEETCVVYGMPKAIVDEQLADEVVQLDEIADAITRFV